MVLCPFTVSLRICSSAAFVFLVARWPPPTSMALPSSSVSLKS
uniref:Uncharacterized protein n=1 Tax=Arundo donax TaxID=35708 RepID=A0A0A9BPM4_ARUDO